MEGHVAKNNESTFPSFVDLDDFLSKHNSNFIWLLVGEWFVAKSKYSNQWILEDNFMKQIIVHTFQQFKWLAVDKVMCFCFMLMVNRL